MIKMIIPIKRIIKKIEKKIQFNSKKLDSFNKNEIKIDLDDEI